MGFFNLFGSFEQTDPDEAVIRQLQKAGSDLSKPHHIDFFLYLPSEASADKVASIIRTEGFAGEVVPPEKDSMWLCSATKTMVPDVSELQRIRREFNGLTGELGGNYDGWGTEVEK